MPDVAPRTVGRYEILRELGRGGASTVHLARQTDLDRLVALKEFHAIEAWAPSCPLSHPNIVTLLDSFERDGTAYLAMEYVARGSLRSYLGRMTLAQIGGVLEGLLAALRHAEAHGVVHRDLKPAHVLVTAGGRVKIADFGTGVTMGTPGYMAPEYAMGWEIGPWSDLYAVGCMTFEMLTGRPPFGGSETPMATLLRHVNEPIPSVRSLMPDVDAQLSDWIERLLVKKPAWRTQHAGDAWAELEEFLVWRLGPLWRRDAPLIPVSVRPAPAPERAPAVLSEPSPPPVRARRYWALPAALVAAVAGVIAACGTADREPPPVTLSAQGIALDVPAEWRRAAGAEPTIPGVDGIVVRGPENERIVFGRGDAKWANRRLLPLALDSGGTLRTTATQDGEQVLRHGVRIAGEPALVYSAPTTKGVATLTCFAKASTCAAIGASFGVTTGRILSLGPDPAFIRGVARVFGWLETRERPLAEQLARGGTRQSQVALTKKLWWTYAGAAKRLRQVDAGPADRQLRRQLAEALRLAGCAYGRAAGHADRAGYAREGELALVHQGDVRRALDGLRAAGYALPPDAAGAARFTRLGPL
jgi:hypothetical protein